MKDGECPAPDKVAAAGDPGAVAWSMGCDLGVSGLPNPLDIGVVNAAPQRCRVDVDGAGMIRLLEKGQPSNGKNDSYEFAMNLLTSAPLTGTMIIGACNSSADGRRAVTLAAVFVSEVYRSRSAAGVRRIQNPKGEEAEPVLHRLQAPATSAELAMPEDHPAYGLPNYGRLFREAVTDSVRDYYREHGDLLVPGHWLIRLKKRAPWIPARTYWCDHEPGNPENKLDRWPVLFLAGEVAGEVADPLDIFGARARVPLEPQGVLKTAEQEYAYRIARFRYIKKWEPENPLANPYKPVRLELLPPISPFDAEE